MRIRYVFNELGLFWALTSTGTAFAQPTHGIGARIACGGTQCIGDQLNCTGDGNNVDAFADALQINEFFAIVNEGQPGQDRVPEVGSLPIVEVFGNSTCKVGGDFPCIIGPPACTAFGLPGDLKPGLVRVGTLGEHAIEEDDVTAGNVVPTRMFLVFEDLCNGEDDCTGIPDCCDGTSDPGCDEAPVETPTPINNTTILNCDDGVECTIDSCKNATCFHDPDDANCDDGMFCNGEENCDLIKDCQPGVPVTCDDDIECTKDSCDDKHDMCVFLETDQNCDDGNICTDDFCEPDEPNANADGCVYPEADPLPENCTEGGEGCTPGYWKLIEAGPSHAHHECNWVDPYDPSDLFSESCADCGAALCFDNAFPGMTLHDVLSEGGGGLTALGRHTAAALLNAASPDVSYDLSVCEIVSMFNDVYPGSNTDYNQLKSTFAGFNEDGCCPLGNCHSGDPAPGCDNNGDTASGVNSPPDPGDNVSLEPNEQQVHADNSRSSKQGANNQPIDEEPFFIPVMGCGVVGITAISLLVLALVGLRSSRLIGGKP